MPDFDFPEIWDNSMRSLGRDCPRKLYFFLRGYEPVAKPSYLDWGSAWHKILDTWYQTQDFEKAINAGLKLFDEAGAEEDQLNSREALVTTFRYYVDRYESDPFKLILGATEQGFVWPLNERYYYAGSMDGYIEWEPYGVLCLEHKTTGEYLTDSYISQWEFSPQITGYIWYLSKIHDNVYGALVNMVTKQQPKAKSNWTTPRVARTLVRKTQDDLAEFERDVLHDIEYFYSLWQNDYWPKTTNPRSCVGGPGRGKCIFSRICITQADFRRVDISVYDNLRMRTEKWEPWKRGNE